MVVTDMAIGVGDVRIRQGSGAGAEMSSEVEHVGDDVLHIVGWWQDVMGRVLRLKVPRALCGESLAAGPDRPDLDIEVASTCSRCLALNGRRGGEETVPVPSYRLLHPFGKGE